MASLKEILTADGKRTEVVADCVTLIDEEVASKGGISGMAVKAVYATVKAIKPGIIRHSVDDLLDEFTAALDPFYQSARSSGEPTAQYLQARAGDAAEALLAITDRRAERTRHAAIRKAYYKLRPSGKKHVQEAVPRLGRLIERHAG